MKTFMVGFERSEFGYVEVTVENNATDEEILQTAAQLEQDGMCNWGSEETVCTGILGEI